MNKEDIIITLSGKNMSGKSTLTFLLKQFLREKGFDVELEVNLNYQNESDFDKHMVKNIDERIDYIKETKKITLSEVQLRRDWVRDLHLL